MKTITLFIGDENGLRSGVDDSDGRRARHASALDPEFGHQIRLRREALDLTQTEFGEYIGVHQVTLSRIETATVPLTKKMRILIENGLRKAENDK